MLFFHLLDHLELVVVSCSPFLELLVLPTCLFLLLIFHLVAGSVFLHLFFQAGIQFS